MAGLNSIQTRRNPRPQTREDAAQPEAPTRANCQPAIPENTNSIDARMGGERLPWYGVLPKSGIDGGLVWMRAQRRPWRDSKAGYLDRAPGKHGCDRTAIMRFGDRYASVYG